MVSQSDVNLIEQNTKCEPRICNVQLSFYKVNCLEKLSIKINGGKVCESPVLET